MDDPQESEEALKTLTGKNFNFFFDYLLTIHSRLYIFRVQQQFNKRGTTMDNNFKLNLAKDKQSLCAKIALRRAKRVFALLKAGRNVKKSDLEEILIRFDIYCDIFEEAVKEENELREAESRRIQELKFYMHVETGSVDTEENWVSTIETETDDLKNFKEGTTAQEAFDEYCRDGKFVEVEKDEDGDWKEVQ